MLAELGLRVGTARRVAIDACIGLAVFVVFACGVTLDRTGGVGGFQNMPQFSSAQAETFDGYRKSALSGSIVNRQGTVGQPAVDMAFARTDQTTAIVLLAGIFSAVFAFNLAFYRRLRAGYASSRRRQVHRS